MKSFLAALRFLTVFPVGSPRGEAEGSRMAAALDKMTAASALGWFPVVGGLCGALSAGIYYFAGLFSPGSFLPAVSAVIVLGLLNRALHLDGLADTFDAFLSGKSKDETLSLMRDPHIGTFGTVSIVGVLLLKTGLIASLSRESVLIGLIVAGTISRYGMVFMMHYFAYARKEGKAKLFMENLAPGSFWVATVIALAGAVTLLGVQGFLIMAGAVGVVFLFGRWSQRRIGGITGDVLGAANELGEVFILISMVLLRGGRA